MNLFLNGLVQNEKQDLNTLVKAYKTEPVEEKRYDWEEYERQ